MVDTTDTSEDLGAASADELAAAALDAFGSYADPNLPDPQRFIDAALKTIRCREINRGRDEDPPSLAVFLLCNKPRNAAQKHDAKQDPLFSDGSSQLNGHVWFTQTAMTSGYRLELPSNDPGSVFQFIENDLGMGGMPAVVFNPLASVPQIRFYPVGLSEDSFCHRMDLVARDVTVENITEVLNTFYEQILKVPDCLPPEGRLWKAPDKWIPIENTEGTIQTLLVPFLSASFGGCGIWFEQPTSEGRADIFIVEPSTSPGTGWVFHAALELKVFRSFTSGGKKVPAGKIAQSANDGFLQVVAYREQRKAIHGLLCCYDMRKMNHGDNCFDGLLQKAVDKGIQLKRWYLYRSSSDYRQRRLSR